MLGVLTKSMVALVVTTSLAHAQTTGETPEPRSPPPYQKLRYDEDYSYLADPARPSDTSATSSPSPT